MSEQIIKVQQDPKDAECILITLRHMPKRFVFWRTQAHRITTYKGHGRHWYHLPSFTPAPAKIIPLLKAISYSPAYKHLRYQLLAQK